MKFSQTSLITAIKSDYFNLEASMKEHSFNCFPHLDIKWKFIFFIIILFIVLPQLVLGQSKKINYYDSEWKRVASKQEAAFYRVLEYDINSVLIVPIKDYYITGEIQGVGIPLSFDDKGEVSKWKGTVTGYYKNGNKQFENRYNNKGLFDGPSFIWYEDGKLRGEEHYLNDTLNGTYKRFYPSGNIYQEAIFEKGEIKGKWYKECDEFGNCKRVIHDNLNTPMNPLGWDRSSGKDYSYTIDEELGLICEMKPSNSHHKLVYLPINQNVNFSIEISFYIAELDEQLTQGLIWGMKDWDNFHFFGISSTQEFYIGSVYDGLKIKSKDWEKSQYIKNQKSDVNTIKVSRYGENIYFSINGEVVFNESFKGFRGNYQGYSLASSSTSKMGIGNFRVTEDMQTGSITKGSDIKSSGSCFLIDPNGYAVTNYHVVDQAEKIAVQFLINEQKVEYPAEVVVVDKLNDLALIKATGENFPLSGNLRYNFVTEVREVGTEVFTLGFPAPFGELGEEVKFADGKISAKTGFDNDVRTYQITVPVQPGNSGGPLYDYDGNLVGVINAKYTPGDNVSYALKSNLIKNLIDSAPKKIHFPNDISLAPRSLREKIKIFSGYVGLVIVR